MAKRKLISFDWALKRLLRSKANYEILEGFLSELLKEEITILEILESESNSIYKDNKYNRVDLKVKNWKKEIIIIEVQYEREFDYLQRILFATSKIITEHLSLGDGYSAVTKVISVNILYFDFGVGKDYIYHGKTSFRGIHQQDELQLNSQQKEMFNKQESYEIFPEYYIIKVAQFDDIAKNSLDEWIYFLKNEEIKNEFQAKGLEKAKEILDIMKLSEAQRLAFDKFIDNRRSQSSMLQTSFISGKAEGKSEGIAEGEAKGEAKGITKGITKIAKALKQKNMDLKSISEISGLTIKEIEKL
jgi:predicted transposase/invertase (TIGR01784 family)